MSSWLDELEQMYGDPTPPSPPSAPQVGKQRHLAEAGKPPFMQKCPLCQGPMADRNGKNGVFLGCKNYPTCKGTRNYS